MRSERLKELEKVWYAKLKQSGFEDIEDERYPDKPLKSYSSDLIESKPSRRKNFFKRTTADYYALARRLLETFQFESTLHKRIWSLHCEGLSKRQIEAKLREENVFRVYATRYRNGKISREFHARPFAREQIGNIITMIAFQIV